mmetsp:Transcript_7558/g.21455  ORF Transcript_7558/g.21455 Transcript_7558/m.21455 type:complete len:319 (+) Transcript_7558:408-1364(+)
MRLRCAAVADADHGTRRCEVRAQERGWHVHLVPEYRSVHGDRISPLLWRLLALSDRPPVLPEDGRFARRDDLGQGAQLRFMVLGPRGGEDLHSGAAQRLRRHREVSCKEEIAARGYHRHAGRRRRLRGLLLCLRGGDPGLEVHRVGVAGGVPHGRGHQGNTARGRAAARELRGARRDEPIVARERQRLRCRVDVVHLWLCAGAAHQQVVRQRVQGSTPERPTASSRLHGERQLGRAGARRPLGLAARDGERRWLGLVPAGGHHPHGPGRLRPVEVRVIGDDPWDDEVDRCPQGLTRRRCGRRMRGERPGRLLAWKCGA